jgi:hypothetical protein
MQEGGAEWSGAQERLFMINKYLEDVERRENVKLRNNRYRKMTVGRRVLL